MEHGCGVVTVLDFEFVAVSPSFFWEVDTQGEERDQRASLLSARHCVAGFFSVFAGWYCLMLPSMS